MGDNVLYHPLKEDTVVYDPNRPPLFMSDEQMRMWNEAQRNVPDTSGEDIFLSFVVAMLNLLFLAALVGIPWAIYNALFYVVYGGRVYAVIPTAFALTFAAFIYESMNNRHPTKFLAWLMLTISITWGTYKTVWTGSDYIDTAMSVGGAISGIAVAIRRLRQVYGHA